MDILAKAGMPLSLPAIVRGRKNLPQSSAYRNLAELEAAGLIRRVASEDGFARYELAEELTGHHHHLMCSRAAVRSEDLHIPAPLERRLDRTLDVLAREAAFATVRHRLDPTGLCAPAGARDRRPLTLYPWGLPQPAGWVLGRTVTLTRTAQADEHAVPPPAIRSRRLGSWWVIVASAILLPALGWRFIADPSLSAPTRDPAWYTWRAGLILEDDPGSIAADWGPDNLFSGGYRVTVPLAGALLQRVQGSVTAASARS